MLKHVPTPLIVLGFVIFFACIWSMLPGPGTDKPALANLGLATDIAVSTPDGKQVKLFDFKGRVTLIDLWATWCGPCRQSIPSIIQAYEKYHSRGFEVIGPALERDSGDGVGPFAREMRIPYPVGVPADRESIQPYATRGIPTMALIDKHGNVRWRQEGFSSEVETELNRNIAFLLDE